MGSAGSGGGARLGWERQVAEMRLRAFGREILKSVWRKTMKALRT
jgi:hypothetical protein